MYQRCALTNEQEIKLRPKFLASILFVLGAILLIGHFYTIGLWLPMLFFSAYLFFTVSKDVVGIAPYKYFKIVFFVVLIIGLFVHWFLSLKYSLCWFITAAFLSFSFKVVRLVGAAISTVLPFTNT